ncbi:hypothetical protein K3757_18950 (plasmid) [Sulfitobacter sp. S223]|uniref:calcium-binding protein n=1 Tax=Sulfitobacter sp. S223 TaxID=2867023 RepID=UPI0021A95C38|nr:calcium-binding protein [Sulfitobacter sp. S223]UWR28338.1 hypothetical protein K3757_18950 [Sulfitobacter sp. S223]
MGILSFVQTIWGSGLETDGQTSRLDVSQSGAARTLVLHDTGAQNKSTVALGTGSVALRDVTTRDLSTADQLNFQMNGNTRSLDAPTLDRLVSSGGDSATAYLDGVGFYGNAVVLHTLEAGGRDYVYMARPVDAGIGGYVRAANGALSVQQEVPDAGSALLSGISAMDSTTTANGRSFLVAASQQEDGLTVFSVGSNGRLTAQESFGFVDRLPVSQPTVLRIIEMGDERFAVMGAAATGSLTVLGLSDSGDLSFVDQINDTRDTRFDGISALDHVTTGGMTLLAVGGSDGGISLFQLLPEGRLLLRENIEDGLDTAMDGIRQLRFMTHENGAVELLVLSSRDNGITRFEVDLGPGGITATGRDGGSGNDILTASDGGMQLEGHAGDDVLLDGAGSDRLNGGAGADVFIFSPDGQNDTIRGFDIAEDRIELSAYGAIYDFSALSLKAQTNGARISFGDESLTIQTVDGARLNEQQMRAAILFDVNHVVIPEPIASSGGAENDQFFAGIGPDTVDGGAGFDILSFATLPTAVRVDLSNATANAGGAYGYVIRNVEGLIGTDLADVMTGDSGANSLATGAGNDTVRGGNGADWITPGAGSDRVDGGAGNDMVSFADLSQGVAVDLSNNTAISGGDKDTLTNVERVTGTIFGDFITGDAQDNHIRALGDYDWLTGSDGHDTLDGGNGRDMVSYVFAPTPVVVDLGAGKGLWGQALGDTYISIERVTGSVHADRLIGSDGEDDFRGLGGYDWFVGSGGGKDRYDGGSGYDTVAYSSSSGSVTASLISGRGMAGDAARDLYTSIESLTGSNYADILTGDHGRNVLRGMWGEDTLRGNGGVDRIYGGGSDDFIDGGSGWDYALFDHDKADYAILHLGNAVRVTYLPGGGEGTDSIFNVEVLKFADGDIYL